MAHVENHGPVEDRHEDLDDYTVNFLSFGQDDQMQRLCSARQLPDDRCSSPHWGYVFRGQMTFRFADHDEVFQAGDAFYVPAGHSPVIDEGGTEYVQFSPSSELHTVSDVMTRNAEALGIA